MPFDLIESSGLFGVTLLPDIIHQQELAFSFLLLLTELDFKRTQNVFIMITLPMQSHGLLASQKWNSLPITGHPSCLTQALELYFFQACRPLTKLIPTSLLEKQLLFVWLPTIWQALCKMIYRHYYLCLTKEENQRTLWTLIYNFKYKSSPSSSFLMKFHSFICTLLLLILLRSFQQTQL